MGFPMCEGKSVISNDNFDHIDPIMEVLTWSLHTDKYSRCHYLGPVMQTRFNEMVLQGMETSTDLLRTKLIIWLCPLALSMSTEHLQSRVKRESKTDGYH